MDQFDSCYFCGEAFDASLSEYPVVPKELQSADEGPTVVLCGTCRRKLGAVVETVVGAAEGDGTATAQRDTSTDSGATDGTEATASADGALLDDAATTDTDDSTATTADEWESPATDDEPDGDARDDEATTPSEGDTAAAASETDDGADATATGDDTSGAQPTMTKLEYNKVMRLLQNRQFPVDRGEIREVATSAYDIDPQEFDAVIEAAVSRDLIGVENGQFVDPE